MTADYSADGLAAAAAVDAHELPRWQDMRIDRLQEENAALREQVEQAKEAGRQLFQQLQKAEADNAALRKDAERYRLLRKSWSHPTPEQMDAYLDSIENQT